MKTILFIENKSHVRENFIRILTAQDGLIRVLTAANLSESIETIEKIKVDLVVVGRQFNAKELEILDLHLQNNGPIRLVTMAAKKSELAHILKALEHNIHFEMPVDANLLMETVLRELEIDTGGTIRGIGLPSFLQMIEMEGKTCTVVVLAGKNPSYLYFDAGDLIDAQVDGLEGKPAALKVLVQENCLIRLDYGPHGRPRTIVKPLMSLLLESGRLKDERDDENGEKRKAPRIQCRLPVSYGYKDLELKGTIRDIGLGGTFIESRAPLPLGEEIRMDFYSSSLDRFNRLTGKIVHINPDGFGIAFSGLSMKQKMFLRTVLDEVEAS